ncbi:MAG: hypothetical protein ABIQ41_09840 [Gemmatimonadales bacterium]
MAQLAALFLGSALVSTSLSAQQAAPQRGPEAASTSVTLYQDGRVLVRRAFPMRIPLGASVQRVALGPVDPSSLVSLDSSVSITGAFTSPGADPDGALRAAVGKLLTFRSGIAFRDTVSATLVGVDPARVRFADGTIFFGLPGQPTFPADQIPAQATADVRVQARRAADQLRLGGFAPGGGWNAMYAVVLRGATGQVSGLASFTAPFTAEDAEVQLLAGQVNQAQQAPQMRQVVGMAARAMEAQSSDVAGQQKVGEFHLYTLGGRHQLRPGTMTSVALFEPATAPVARSYEVHSSVPFYGYWGQTGDEGETPVAVYYTLTRARRTPFGDAPLPGGAVRIFQPDSAGRLQLIGEAGLGHTAPGEELRINAGSAFDLVAKRIQTDWQQGTEPVPAAPRRTRTFVNSAYADTLRNQGDTEALIDVLVERGGDWRIIESSQPAERLTSTRARFRVKVPARGEAVVTYRIRATW